MISLIETGLIGLDRRFYAESTSDNGRRTTLYFLTEEGHDIGQTEADKIIDYLNKNPREEVIDVQALPPRGVFSGVELKLN